LSRIAEKDVSVAGNGIFRAETKRPKRPWRFKDAGAETNLIWGRNL
jgi:hypothetical protein